MASVTLAHVKKVYDKNVVAVHDFNLEIKDKEFIVLIGIFSVLIWTFCDFVLLGTFCLKSG